MLVSTPIRELLVDFYRQLAVQTEVELWSEIKTQNLLKKLQLPAHESDSVSSWCADRATRGGVQDQEELGRGLVALPGIEPGFED